MDPSGEARRVRGRFNASDDTVWDAALPAILLAKPQEATPPEEDSQSRPEQSSSHPPLSPIQYVDVLESDPLESFVQGRLGPRPKGARSSTVNVLATPRCH